MSLSLTILRLCWMRRGISVSVKSYGTNIPVVSSVKLLVAAKDSSQPVVVSI